MFLGVFAGYLFLGFLVDGNNFSSIFQFQLDFLNNQQGLSKEVIDSFFVKPLEPSLANVAGVVQSNFTVMLICFALSIFYAQEQYSS